MTKGLEVKSAHQLFEGEYQPEQLEAFSTISNLITRASGIELSSDKYFLIETRIHKRMRELRLDLKGYSQYLLENQDEVQICIELITTHKTEWFREIVHFQWLKQHLQQNSSHKDIKIWSAASSSGEEAYSLLFLLLKLGYKSRDIKILGTDISQSIIDQANHLSNSDSFREQKRQLLEKVKDPAVVSRELELALHSSIKFRQFNLLDPSLSSNILFDVIFLRNVLIYFERSTVIKICRMICKHLKPEGHLVLGVSESIQRDIPELQSIGNSIYKYNPNLKEISQTAVKRIETPRTEVPKGQSKTKILVVEDSPSIQKILSRVYSTFPNSEVIGVAESVADAISKMNQYRPDLISLDMKLKDGTGLEFLEKCQFEKVWMPRGVKCILVTDCSSSEGNLVFDSMARGASHYIQKPQASDLQAFSDMLKDLICEFFSKNQTSRSDIAVSSKRLLNLELNKFKLILIGSSTGGTEVVRDILAGFPSDAPPIVVVQHMPENFTGFYAERLNHQTRPTQEVLQEMRLERGRAYLAHGGAHVVIERRGGDLWVKPDHREPVNRFRPSVSVLFESVLKGKLAQDSLGIILTGMGKDGSKEMLMLREAGTVTIGQSKDSCVVYGMPRAAEELGALQFSASPQEMIAAACKRPIKTNY